MISFANYIFFIIFRYGLKVKDRRQSSHIHLSSTWLHLERTTSLRVRQDHHRKIGNAIYHSCFVRSWIARQTEDLKLPRCFQVSCLFCWAYLNGHIISNCLHQAIHLPHASQGYIYRLNQENWRLREHQNPPRLRNPPSNNRERSRLPFWRRYPISRCSCPFGSQQTCSFCLHWRPFHHWPQNGSYCLANPGDRIIDRLVT